MINLFITVVSISPGGDPIYSWVTSPTYSPLTKWAPASNGDLTWISPPNVDVEPTNLGNLALSTTLLDVYRPFDRDIAG